MSDRESRVDGEAAQPTVRTPEHIRNNGNHLQDEPSLYLQQHAHNPIDWYPWGEAALSRAAAEDKPIFLSIGYSSCHWCHVMEHEVFEHDDVATFMNEHFICIKVDREERPDLDKVYMEAVMMLTGRGGWPMSVWLTPDQKPFYGGTYFPKAQFMQLVTRIQEIYTTRRTDIDQQAGALAARIAADPPLSELPDTDLSNDLLTTAVDQAKSYYDPVNAGFSQQQKFPTPVKWRFLLHDYRRTGDEELGRMITATCTAMAGGGIYDHVAGGFHRYTVDENWTVPHFEKMLYDNAQLAGLFLEAGVALERPDFTAVGVDVLDFLLKDMRGKNPDEEGGFYASYDADSGGEEGTYYIWSREDIAEVVGLDDGPVLADVLGITAQGNFEHTGKSVLTRRADLAEIAGRSGRSEDAVADLIDTYRADLRRVRDQRTPPGLDRKIITSWNGLAIAALAQGYAVTGDETYLRGATRAADYLLREHRRDDGSLRRASSEGRPTGDGILDDYAFLADGLLELYQVSGETRWLAAARQLIDLARRDFSRDDGTYYLTSATGEAPLGRTVDYSDSVIPSGNAVMLDVQIKLAAITGETKYLTESRAALTTWSGFLARAGVETAGWLDAAAKLIHPYHDVVIAGDDGDDGTATLRRAALGRLPANAVVSLVPGGGPDDDLLAIAPALQGKVAVKDRATAYVCEFGICQRPTTEVDEMLTQLGGKN